MRWVAVLAGLLLTAGCLGIGSDNEPVGPSSEDPEQPPADDTMPNETTFTFTETPYDGTITGARTLVVATNTPDSDTILEVEIGEDPVKIGFLVAPSGGPIEMLVAEPGCEVNSGCEESVRAEDQADAAWNETAPSSGTWTLRFFYGEEGVGEVDWRMDAIAKIPDT